MTKDQLEQAIAQRLQEVDSYQINIDNYSRMLDKLTGEWCPTTEPFRGLDSQQLAERVDDEDLMLRVSDLNFRDKLRCALKAERMEQRKAKLVLSVLQDRLRGD